MYYNHKADSIIKMTNYQIDFDPIVRVLLYIPNNRMYYAEYFRKEYGEHFSLVCNDESTVDENDFDIFVYIDVVEQPSGCRECYHLIGKVFPLSYAWSFRNGDHKRINLYYRSNYFHYFLRTYLPINLHTFLLEPLMYYIGLFKDVTLLHAASADRNGQGLIVAAQSGCGKTSTVFRLVRGGCGFLGDDLVWVSGNGDLIRYPRLIHLFSYVLQYSSFLTLSWGLRAYLKIKDFLRRIMELIVGEQFNIATRVDIKDLIASVEIVNRTVLAGFFFMRKEASVLVEEIDDSNRFVSIESIMEVNEPMGNLFDNFFNEDKILREKVIQKQKELLDKILHSTKSFVVSRELVKTEITSLLRLVDDD